VLARLGHGEPLDPAAYYFRTTPRFDPLGGARIDRVAQSG
jgi:hypothetical protein